MDVAPVLELLREKIGLNPESVGTASIEKAIQEQVEKSGVANIEDYVKKVNGSVAELNRLVESVVVQETSFFRNRTPFITLQNYLKQFALNKKWESPLRILCLPCSTGEEAYSIAMVLMDMNLFASQFYIFAADISEQVLQIAKAGRYTSYSFRGEDIAYRKKYFTKQADGTYLLKKVVRDAVRFEPANILADHSLRGHKPYDVIFCRNLLIYFDDAAKEKTIKTLSGHLSKEGILFLGHAEGSNIAQFGFVSLDYPMSFAFARKGYAAKINELLGVNHPEKKSISVPAPVQQKAIKVEALNNTRKITPAKSDLEKSDPAKSDPDKNSKNEISLRKNLAESHISAAQRLADAGSFSEVEAVCEKLLSEGVESAEVYYLLGQAAGSNGEYLLAEEYLKKAIYLNADFYDALIYLSSLFSQMGNPEKAAIFSRRAQRVKQRVKLRKERGAVQ